jgi:hypothetical protein
MVPRMYFRLTGSRKVPVERKQTGSIGKRVLWEKLQDFESLAEKNWKADLPLVYFFHCC